MPGSVSSITSSSSHSAGEDVCRYCKRSRTTPNPCVRRYPDSSVLVFVANERICTSCRNYLATAAKGRRAQALIWINSSSSNLGIYLVNLAGYEAKWDAAACNDGRVSHAGIATLPLDDVVSTVHTAAMVFGKSFGVFWPVTLWEERTQKKSDPKRHRWI